MLLLQIARKTLLQVTKCGISPLHLYIDPSAAPPLLLLLIFGGYLAVASHSAWCCQSASLPPSCGPPPAPSAALSPGLHDVSLTPPPHQPVYAFVRCTCTHEHARTHGGKACDLIGYHLRFSNSDSTRAIYSRGGSLHTGWHVMTPVAACLCGKAARGTWKKF